MARQRSFVIGMFIIMALIAGCATPASRHADAPAFESGYAPVNGLKMYYEIHGSDTRGNPPLVLLHGGGSTIETSFGKILPGLAKDRQVIAFEQQGHGHTADIDRPFTFEQSAEDTVALLRYLKIRKADFIGYSNGGHIALEIALRHPDMVRKLVLESIMIDTGRQRPGVLGVFQARETGRHAIGIAGGLPENGAPSGRSARVLRKVRAADEGFQGLDASRGPVDRCAHPGHHRRSRYRPPGTRRPDVPPDPNARLAILPDTDHMTIVKRFDWLLPMLGTFLDSPMQQARLK